MLNQESQKLARKITRDAKISQARRENAKNQISGYVYDTPVIHGGRGVLRRGSGELPPSVDKTSELVSQVDLVKRIKPTAKTQLRLYIKKEEVRLDANQRRYRIILSAGCDSLTYKLLHQKQKQVASDVGVGSRDTAFHSYTICLYL